MLRTSFPTRQDDLEASSPPDALCGHWDRTFEKLSQFKATHGHIRVPARGDDKNLYGWMGWQRRYFKAGTLLPSRKAKLDSLGFNWNPIEDGWNEMLSKLKDVRERWGKTDVAFLMTVDKELALWVNRQKGSMAAGKVPPERVQLLVEVGLEPAKRVHRNTNADVTAGREKTLQDYASHIALTGSGLVAPDPAPDSLYQRLKRLRHVASRNPSSALYAELTRLGAYIRYANPIWEDGFAHWAKYARESGDFACLASPPTDISLWAADTRALLAMAELDWLATPLKTRYERHPTKAQSKLRKRLELLEYAKLVRRRALYSGFNPRPIEMHERLLLAVRISRTVSLPAPARTSLKLALKCLSVRKMQGGLSSQEESLLREIGMVWHARRRRWFLASNEQRYLGGRVFTLQQKLPRVSFSAPKARPAPSPEAVANTPKSGYAPALAAPAAPSTNSEPFVGPRPLRKLRNLPLLHAVKHYFSKNPQPISENDLRRVSEIRDLVLRGGEVNLALLILLQAGWLKREPIDSPQGVQSVFSLNTEAL